MARYFRLYLYFIQFSISRAMEFRLDFYFRIVMDLIYYAVNLGFFRILYLHTPVLGGWSQEQAMVFVGFYLVIDAFNMIIYSTNMWWLPVLVNRGDLDYYLTRPVSTLFFVSLREFSLNSVVNLVFALGILAWALLRLPGGLSGIQWALVGPLLLVGTILHYLIQMVFLLPVFWTHSEGGLRNVYHSMGRLTERPDRIFTGWVRGVLVTVLPFSLVASFPARLVAERLDWRVGIHFGFVFVAFFALILWIWDRGLKSYSSASS